MRTASNFAQGVGLKCHQHFRLHKQQTLLQKYWGRSISTSGDMLLASFLLSRSLGVSAAMSPVGLSSRSFLGTRKYLHGHHGSRHKRLCKSVGLERPDIPQPLTLAMRHSRTAASPRIQDKRPEPRGRSQDRGRRPLGLWSWRQRRRSLEGLTGWRPRAPDCTNFFPEGAARAGKTIARQGHVPGRQGGPAWPSRGRRRAWRGRTVPGRGRPGPGPGGRPPGGRRASCSRPAPGGRGRCWHHAGAPPGPGAAAWLLGWRAGARRGAHRPEAPPSLALGTARHGSTALGCGFPLSFFTVSLRFSKRPERARLLPGERESPSPLPGEKAHLHFL